MASQIEIPCPECDKPMKFPEEMAGKKVRCKACGHVFRVEVIDVDDDEPVRKKPKKKPEPKKSVTAKPPAKVPKGKPDPKKAAPGKPKGGGDDEADANPYGMTEEYLGKRCPFCASAMEDDDVICLECGYNTNTREKLTSKKVAERTFWDWLLWLFPAIAGVIVIMALVGFDVWYFQWSPPNRDSEEWSMENAAGNKGIKLWMIIGSIFVMVSCGIFAVKRLVFNPIPPEREKPMTATIVASVIAGLVIGSLMMLGGALWFLLLVLMGFPPGCCDILIMWALFSGGWGAVNGALQMNK